MAVVRYCPIADLDIQINFHFVFLTPLFLGPLFSDALLKLRSIGWNGTPKSLDDLNGNKQSGAVRFGKLHDNPSELPIFAHSGIVRLCHRDTNVCDHSLGQREKLLVGHHAASPPRSRRPSSQTLMSATR